MSEPEIGGTGPASDSLPQRCGFIAIIGAPNAGKSTLVNAIVGAKVSIVSHKVQTTRMQVRGIAIEGASQLVFIDTPGIFQPKRRLDRAMVKAAWTGAGEGDILGFMIDAARGIDDDATRILDRLGDQRGRKIAILNKVDRVADKEKLLGLASEMIAKSPFERVFMISALDGSGVADLRSYLAGAVPEGPWHYPDDDVSDLPLRILAAEITREKIYHWLHEELPYATTVETTSWKDLKDGSVRIEQTIYVERDSQRSIVLGAKGATIKRLSMDSRREISAIIERPVHLFLFVKVRENWEGDPERYRDMGLEYPND